MAKRKAALNLLFCGIPFLSVILGGCSLPLEGKTPDLIGIFSGVLAWGRQDWPSSISSFMETSIRSESEGNTILHDYAEYGLASVYLSQDELSASDERLSRIDTDSSAELGAAVWYQRGVIAYRKGSFKAAADCFKHSLEQDSRSLDAKINLELSRRSQTESTSSSQASASGIDEQKGSATQADTIFNLIRKKEQDRWKNQAEQETEAESADY